MCSSDGAAGNADASAADLLRAYRLGNQLPILQKTLAVSRAEVADTPTDDPDRAARLLVLSDALCLLGVRTADASMFAEAVEHVRAVSEGTPEDHPERVRRLVVLSYVLSMSRAHGGDTSRVAEEVEIDRTIVAMTSEDDPDRYKRLFNLGSSLWALYEHTADPALLVEQVETLRFTVALTPPDQPEYARHLYCFGLALWGFRTMTGHISLLSEELEVRRAVLAATPRDDPAYSERLTDLGVSLWEWRIRPDEDRRQDLRAARRRAVAAANRAIRLFDAYECGGEIRRIDEAVALLEPALAVFPDGHINRAIGSSNLANLLVSQYEHRGDPEMLALAVHAGRAGVAGTPTDHQQRGIALSNLAGSLQHLFEHSGETAVLLEAVEALRIASRTLPTGHRGRRGIMANLGLMLRALFDRTGDLDALVEAVAAGRDAIEGIRFRHPKRALYLSNLGGSLQRLFDRTGDVDALAEAIAVRRGALSASPGTSADRAKYLVNLGGALFRQFERTAEIDLLVEATDLFRAAATIADGRPDAAMCLSNLGGALNTLFTRTGDERLLDEALRAARDAVVVTPNDHPDRARHVSNLGIRIQALAEATKDPEALDEAVRVAHDAVAATPDDHPDHASRLNNLGLARRLLGEHQGSAEILDTAARDARDAVNAAAPDHPDRATYLANLGGTLRIQFDQSRQPHFLIEALECFWEAARTPAAPVWMRISSYWNVVAVSEILGRPPLEALDAVEAAVALLPRLVARSLGRRDREYQVGRVASLSGIAAAVAVAANQPDRAVELLEMTRGILVSEVLARRGPELARLEVVAPGRADAFKKLHARRAGLDAIHMDLAAPGEAADPAAIRQAALDVAQSRRDNDADWDRLLEDIRTIGGFANFLRPPDVASLAGQASRGPVVFVYTSPIRCGALLLYNNARVPVVPVPLPDLTESDAHKQAQRIQSAVQTIASDQAGHEEHAAAEREILTVLAWLWDAVTGPVLDALDQPTSGGHPGLVPPGDTNDGWPRVWWCPVGILASLPLHAAGHHDDPANDDLVPRCVLDRVISCYATTVRGLADARTDRPLAAADAAGRTVIIAVPDPPDTAQLPGADAEARTLCALIPFAYQLPHPNHGSVLHALPQYEVAHFACHGHVDLANPASSRLVLHDHLTAPLTVADVGAMSVTGRLAYLSACDTNITNLQLADEAVHMTGAFHLAGYRHVVGTLWPVDDYAARTLATDFYGTLTGGGSGPPDTSIAADALHHAVRRLRSRYPEQPSLWATHTYTGV